MDGFSRLHPSVLLLYFLAALIAVLSFNNPVISAVSLICAVIYSFARGGKSAVKSIGFSLIVIIAVSLFNMLFAHYGNTVLFTFSKTEFTLEALFYGFNQGMVAASSLLWFTAMGKTLSSEKTVYLFRYTPRLALLFSMIIGFIPRFFKKQRDIREARLALNSGNAPKGFKERLQASAGDLSALASYALEGSIITANSMEARGYNPSVIRRGRFRFKAQDAALLVIILALFVFVLIQKLIGNLSFVFEPDIYIERLSLPAVFAFLVFGLIPSFIDFKEVLLWKLSGLKA